MPERDEMTLVEFADKMGIGAYTARSWVKCGRLPARKTKGGRWVVDRTALRSIPITASEFARAMGIDRRTVVRWCAAGKLKSWRRPVAYRLCDSGDTPRRTAWEIDAGEIDRLTGNVSVIQLLESYGHPGTTESGGERVGVLGALRESREILELRALRESREILESAKRQHAAKKAEDKQFNGPIKTTKSRTRTTIPRKRGGH